MGQLLSSVNALIQRGSRDIQKTAIDELYRSLDDVIIFSL